jgi:tRNA(Arg) A34 adenosine deaminase TadA
MKKILLFFAIFSLLLLFIFLFKSEIYIISGEAELTNEQQNELYNLALKAKDNGDLPISSLLIENNTIIGEGYNTVVSDSDICGHAEINALRNAINKIGINRFMELDKSKLSLISTLEPCEMCKGVLLYYDILNILFLKDKSLFTSLRYNYAEFLYHLTKRKISSTELLNSLYKLHPDY